MNRSADWKKLYDLVNDLIRQESISGLETELIENIDSLVPADRGAPFFEYRNNRPYCVRWPEYSTALIPDFNAHYSRVCPAQFHLETLMLGPVDWKQYSHSEYDTDFNRPLGIGHTMGCGFTNPRTDTTHIIALNRSRRSRPFSRRDARNFRLITRLFAELYRQKETAAWNCEACIRRINLQRGIIPLSNRETEVCGLLCRGFTARKIGGLLAISPRTVERHCLHIYTKMNVANRKELLNLILSTGEKEN
jgi:DNA-binding CsgD family transcriptional regulator